MPLSNLDRLLWAAGLSGHVVLLGVLFGRGRAARFPCFTALIAVSVLRSTVLFLLLDHLRAYTAVYVGTDALDVLLQFAVAYEVAWHTFRPLGRWAPDARRGMGVLVAASLAVALGLTLLAHPGAPGWEPAVLVKGAFFSSTLLSELFLGMVFLLVTVGLPWKTHVARIAHGLGAYSMFDIAIEAGHNVYSAESGARIHETLTYVRMGVYLLCLGYWIVTLWQQAPEPRELPEEIREQLRGLQARVAYDLYTIRSWRKP